MDDKGSFELSRRKFLTALAALPVLSLPWTSADAAVTPFSFVYVTDIHLATGVQDNAFKMLQESQLFFQEIIKGINALKPDFVIFGGDQVETVGNNDANWQLFIDIVQQLHAPWYFVLGEQDVSGKSIVDKMKEFGPDFKGRGITGSDSYWSADPTSTVHLIGLDTSVANSTTGELTEQQLDWLKKDLAANKGKFTIITTHHPLLAPAPYDGGPPYDDYIIPNGSDAREIIGGSTDVRMVLSGHLYMNKVQVERDVFHISCAGLNVYPCQYKYFKVNKDSIVMESFEVPFPALVKRAFKALQSSTFASKISKRNPGAIIQLCEGSAEDQNALLTLGTTKTVKPLSKKQLQEDVDRRDEQLEKSEEEARNKGKSKGKKKDSAKEDSNSKSKEESNPKSKKESSKSKDKDADSPKDKDKSSEKSNDKESSKTDDTKSADTKSDDTKSDDTKSVDAKPVDVKPDESKPQNP